MHKQYVLTLGCRCAALLLPTGRTSPLRAALAQIAEQPVECAGDRESAESAIE